ncbi:MAG: ABC transporter permease [Desulfobacula sp.]|uniref:ABC transporter permease n=1 Tax=Desulfobacula sp. TaxID=2593537 RepID=UPI001EBD4C8E|nr:ABC transporter permease [Desulfobacula sp.]
MVKNILFMKQVITLFFQIYYHWNLLKGFITRDIKGRFAASFGGLVWTVLTPLATIISYFFVFSLVLRLTITPEETGTDKFVIFFLCGFFPWTLFAESLSKSVGILIGESALITKVVFPVELLPVSAVFTTFLINSIGFVIFLFYMAFNEYLNANWFFIPVALLIEMVFVLGLSFFLSAICVFIRDIGELLNIVIMLWFFGTPVIYPFSMVPEEFKFIYSLNPMFEFVNFFRDIILMDTVNIHALMVMSVCALISYCFGAWFFVRSKVAFGDVL